MHEDLDNCSPEDILTPLWDRIGELDPANMEVMSMKRTLVATGKFFRLMHGTEPILPGKPQRSYIAKTIEELDRRMGDLERVASIRKDLR